MREIGWLHDLATARAIGGRAVEQETRHVRADLRREFEELRQGERAAGEFIGRSQNRGSIAAASAETCAMRNAFFQMDAP